jgi:hypothetical protein
VRAVICCQDVSSAASRRVSEQRKSQTMASDDAGETTTMPVTNGDLHPPSAVSPVLSTPGKRKRVSSPEDKSAQDKASTSPEQDKQELDQTLQYLLQILAR